LLRKGEVTPLDLQHARKARVAAVDTAMYALPTLKTVKRTG
jgi:hypothetical protein